MDFAVRNLRIVFDDVRVKVALQVSPDCVVDLREIIASPLD
jgi:hypothetical protein